MNAIGRANALALHLGLGAPAPAAVRPLILPAPKMISREIVSAAPAVSRRSKIWELSQHLHCSIIGTCLATDELRQILTKAKVIVAGRSDHELHGDGVLLARQRDGAAKLLHKFLDRQHRLAISQFDRATTVEEIRIKWREAVKRGDIPGAYWAVLTHPSSTDALVREVFGEIHMLSHLVGAANRADVRRLAALEADNERMRTELRRQEAQLRDGFTARDARIQELGSLLARRTADGASSGDESGVEAGDNCETTTLDRLVADLERRLESEVSRRTKLEGRLERLTDELRQERRQSALAEKRQEILQHELDALEASLAEPEFDGEAAPRGATLDGLSVLYVGGRPNNRGRLRAICEQLGAGFLHHDGGVDERSGLLEGLVSRADIVMFPVDCVSHKAVDVVKRLCRNLSKPYLPLRSAGISSFIAALGRSELAVAEVERPSHHSA